MNEYELQKTWDPVTRLWHWVLALAVCVGWGFGKFMSFDTIQWHFYIGYLILGLMGFRLIWGLLGPQPVRLRVLLPRPGRIWAYLRQIGRRQPSGMPGHNPIGALSVLAMLIAISAQAISGLFIESDDFFEYGPLAAYVADAWINRLTWWHHTLADVIMVLVALHVAAVLFYWLWKRENLIMPMINGWKTVLRTRNDQ